MKKVREVKETPKDVAKWLQCPGEPKVGIQEENSILAAWSESNVISK